MLYLMSTPLAYRTLQAEIDEGIKAGRISSPITNAEANELPYLQVIKLSPPPPLSKHPTTHTPPHPPWNASPIPSHHGIDQISDAHRTSRA